MRKLNIRKIRWIVCEFEKGERSTRVIAGLQGISPRHARRVYEKYRGEKHPRLLKCGRKPKPITMEEESIVLRLRKDHPLCAVILEKILDEQGGRHMGHNRIHRILKEKGLASTEPNKSRRRRWIRYEREHSNSLWHTDWFESPEGEQVIAFEDDASRFVPGFGVFGNATTENAVKALKNAILHGVPEQLMTDHGTQFMSVERESCPDPESNAFQKYVLGLGIEHIKSRVKHPQSNGKVEKFWDNIYKYKKHFGTWKKAFNYYNYKRPHMSLENGKLRTPYQAFIDKTRKTSPKTI